MFNTHEGYSLSDVAAVTNNRRDYNDDCFSGNGWWIILLFLFMMNGYGWNNRGEGRATTREEIAYGFDMNGLENSVRAVQNGLCDGFYALNNGLLTQQLNTQEGFAGINNAVCSLGYQTAQLASGLSREGMQSTYNLGDKITGGFYDTSRQISDGFCTTNRVLERGFADMGYAIATNSTAIMQNSHNDADRILARLDAMENNRLKETISELRSENQALRFDASQCSQNAYLVNQLGPKTPVPAFVVPQNSGCCYNNQSNCF